jgi:CIC family chloride channel protein
VPTAHSAARPCSAARLTRPRHDPPPPPPTLQSLRLRENQLFFFITVLVGVLAGLAAVLFTLAIEWVHRALFGLDPGPARLFLVPTVASLLAGVLLATVFPDVRGSGVPQTKAAFRLHGGVIPFRVPVGKFLMGALCVGSGHSMGREGPSVQIGAGVASAIGQWVGLPAERVRELVPVGAAGALAAAFNTPVRPSSSPSKRSSGTSMRRSLVPPSWRRWPR